MNVNLQSTLSAANQSSNVTFVGPHHPITCQASLWLHEDGRFECEHAIVPPEDERTHHCIDHSIALLLIELAEAL